MPTTTRSATLTPMSYRTSFNDEFTLSRPLTLAEKNEIDAFCDARHEPAENLPGYYCDWRMSDAGDELSVPDSDSFYNYAEWLKVLIDRFFAPWGVLLNGEVTWDGEDSSDMGKLVLKDNVLTVKRAKIVYE